MPTNSEANTVTMRLKLEGSTASGSVVDPKSRANTEADALSGRSILPSQTFLFAFDLRFPFGAAAEVRQMLSIESRRSLVLAYALTRNRGKLAVLLVLRFREDG